MKEETEIWLDKAVQDARVVTILMQNNESPPAIICFHCQQAAEKYFKAYLVEQGIEFPRTHDLVLLLEEFLLKIDVSFSELLPSATMLTEFAVTTRYPDSVEDIDLVTARNAYGSLTLIQSFVMSKLNKDKAV